MLATLHQYFYYHCSEIINKAKLSKHQCGNFAHPTLASRMLSLGCLLCGKGSGGGNAVYDNYCLGADSIATAYFLSMLHYMGGSPRARDLLPFNSSTRLTSDWRCDSVVPCVSQRLHLHFLFSSFSSNKGLSKTPIKSHGSCRRSDIAQMCFPDVSQSLSGVFGLRPQG